MFVFVCESVCDRYVVCFLIKVSVFFAGKPNQAQCRKIRIEYNSGFCKYELKISLLLNEVFFFNHRMRFERKLSYNDFLTSRISFVLCTTRI